MKVVILGGSTPHTVGLIEALLEQGKAGDPQLELHLVGRDEARLEAVAGFCRRRVQAEEAGSRLRIEASTHAGVASRNTDLFVFQVRPGGLAGRACDERFPLAFGIPGDEGLGPGGLSAALRDFQVFQNLLPALQASPTAPILMLTNPLGLSGRWFQEHHAGQVLGVCELPQVTLENTLGHAPDAGTDASYTGLNHQGFWFRISQDGCDMLAEVLAQAPRWMHHPMAGGALPLSYWRLYFDREQVVREQSRRATPRAADLAALCTRLEQECREGSGTLPLPSEACRSKPWYSLVVAPMLLARVRGLPMELFANQAAGPGHPYAAPGCPVERRVSWDAETQALAEEPAPAALLPLLRRVAMTEEAAWHACTQASLPLLRETLQAMPLCDHLSQGDRHRLADQILRHAGVLCA